MAKSAKRGGKRAIEEAFRRLGLQASTRQVIESLRQRGIAASDAEVQQVRVALLQRAPLPVAPPAPPKAPRRHPKIPPRRGG